MLDDGLQRVVTPSTSFVRRKSLETRNPKPQEFAPSPKLDTSRVIRRVSKAVLIMDPKLPHSSGPTNPLVDFVGAVFHKSFWFQPSRLFLASALAMV
eukprot:5646245-Amphidinium_carterae.1